MRRDYLRCLFLCLSTLSTTIECFTAQNSLIGVHRTVHNNDRKTTQHTEKHGVIITPGIFSRNKIIIRQSTNTDRDNAKTSTTTKRNNNNNNKRKNTWHQNKQLEQEIIRLGRKGHTDEALALYKTIEDPTVRLVNCAIDACARARPTRLQEAFAIFEEAEVKQNEFTFGALVSACARARNANRALSVLRSMKSDYGIAPNAVIYSTVISAVSRTDPPQPQVALDLIYEATMKEKLYMNVVGYNAAIAACAGAGDWQRAVQVLNQMEGRNSTNAIADTALVEPDSVTYGTVLMACEKSEQWELLLQYAQIAMEEKNMQLDALALTSVLHACQQLGLAKEALHYLDMMKEAMANDNNNNRRARKTSGWQRKGARQPLQGPDAVSYRLAISACARGGDYRSGIRLLEDFQNMTQNPPDVIAYTAAIQGCEYAGEWKVAFGLLEKMRKDGVTPNEVTMAAVIGACGTACAKAMAKANKQERSIEEIEANNEFIILSSVRSPPQSTEVIAKKAALKLLNVLKKDNTTVDPNIMVYNAAIRTCAEACDLKRAMSLIKEIREQTELEPTIVTYGTLMTACERVGSLLGISQVFKIMKEDDILPNEIVYGAAISCCRKANEPERALLLLRKMVKEGLSPNVATFNTVIMAQSEGNDKAGAGLDRALLVFKIMQSKELKHNIHGRPNRQTYNLLVRQYAAARKPREAEAFIRKMQREGMVPDVDLYTATVTAYERNGQPIKALRLMESMQEDGYDFYEVEVLNAAFKKMIKLTSRVVGRGWNKKKNKRKGSFTTSAQDEEDDDEEWFLNFDYNGNNKTSDSS